ncbi:multidrug effflux MFS transporter [Angustibacter luteus]|uniref:Multidrug effflux MFS transporter n=1 Tax=Angustibacter luteus TaxID=658456 RepID=A0ABW1JEP4_9ACTN
MTTACPPDTTTAPAVAAPTSRVGRLGVPIGLVVVLGALQGIGPLSLDTYLPALPDIAHDLSASTSATQLTLTATLAGLAVGQLFFGPMSDRLGRRRPLIVGLAVYVVASLLCAVAPNIGLLIAGRTLQGFTAAAGMVSAMAIARDVSNGAAMARLFAALMLVTGAAPVIAPVLGGQLLLVTSWRGIFGLLAVAGVLLLLTATFRVPETLPVERRRVGGFGETVSTFRRLVRDPGFRTPLLAMVLSCAGLFGYLAGSPFLLQDVHGLSAQAYSALFAVNTIGLTGLSQLSGRIVHRTGPRVLLLAGTSICAVGGLGLLAATLAGAGLLAIVPALFLVVSGMGFVFPNATALALADHGDTAGSASALLGTGQFLAGAVAAPLVGLGPDASLTMAVVIAVVTVASVGAALSGSRRRELALA